MIVINQVCSGDNFSQGKVIPSFSVNLSQPNTEKVPVYTKYEVLTPRAQH